MMELPIYRSAVRQFGQRVKLVRNHQWTRSTPDPAWTVADLVEHVTCGQLDVARRLRADPPDPMTAPDSPTGFESTTAPDPMTTPDPMTAPGPTDPPGRWAAASTAAVNAFAMVTDWSTPVPGPDGPVPADELLWRTATELSIHAWDLARAIGAPDELPNDLLAHVLDQVREHGDRWFTGDSYAPAIPVPGCTEDLIELLARAGRNRWWRPS